MNTDEIIDAVYHAVVFALSIANFMVILTILHILKGLTP